MKVSLPLIASVLLIGAALPGCTELAARRHARDGNRFYLEGNYAAALEQYTAAEDLLPSLPQIPLNKGLSCRQLMRPGAKTAENERFVQCALKAFQRLKELRPEDPRGDQLYVQTLFDADRFETLANLYGQKLQARPDDLAAINGLIQVYSRWDRWDDALRFMMRRAEVAPRDAEAKYAVGVFIWNRLFQKGGSGDRATFDPRSEVKQPPLPFGEGDIFGDDRVRLSDQGISYLEKALAIRPNFREAMIYLNLLHRQKSLAFFERPQDFQASIDQAEIWRKKAIEADAAHKATRR